MKTTIEINGYEIVIEENEGLLTVSALKDGETVEEFELEAADEEGSEESFDREEEADFDETDGDIDDVEDDLDDVEDDLDDVEDDLETEEGLEEGKLESFNSFIRKRR